MRSAWKSLHQILIRSLTTSSSLEHFQALRHEDVVLAPFASAEALLELLAHRSRYLDQIDQLYAALVRAAQRGVRTAQVAHTLLMCGLWPGLDRFYHRRVHRFRDDPQELSSAIPAALTLLVGRVDLHDVHRLAATLVRSTGRDVTADLHPARREEEADEAEIEAAPQDAAPGQLEILPDEQRTDEAFRLELQRLHRVLRPILNEDTEWVLRVLVLEELEYQAAAHLGITTAAARKRFQRALMRLRAHLHRSEPWLAR